jgi:hypothetical protein
MSAALIAGFFEPDDSRAKAAQETCGSPKRFNDPVEKVLTHRN